MVRCLFATCVLMLVVQRAPADERFRVYNNTDVELKVIIWHTSAPVSWKEQLEVGAKKPPLGGETLQDGTRVLVVMDALTGQVYLTSSFTTVPGGGRRIKLTGTAPNIHQSYEVIPAGAPFTD